MEDSLSGEYIITISGPDGRTWTWRGYASNYGDAKALADLKRDEWTSD